VWHGWRARRGLRCAWRITGTTSYPAAKLFADAKDLPAPGLGAVPIKPANVALEKPSLVGGRAPL